MARGRRQIPTPTAPRGNIYGALRGTTLPLRVDRLREMVAGELGALGRTDLAERALDLDDRHWENAAVCIRAGWDLDGLELLYDEGKRWGGDAMGHDDIDGRGLKEAARKWAVEILRLRLSLASFQPPQERRPPVEDLGAQMLERLCDSGFCDESARALRTIGTDSFRSSGPTWLRSMGLARHRVPQTSYDEARRNLWSCLGVPLPDGRPLGLVRQQMEPEAMREFVSALAGSPGWRVPRIVRLAGDEKSIHLSAGVDAVLDGRRFRWEVTLPLARVRSTLHVSVHREVSGVITDLGLPTDQIAEGVSVTDLPFGRGPVCDDAPAYAVAAPDARRLASSPACRHGSASWRAVAAWSRLWCPECESELNCVPRHRMGDGDPRWAVPGDARQESFRQLGDLLAVTDGRGVPRTVTDIPDFGVVPALEPTAYASSPARGTRRDSLADAFGTRRR